MIIFEGYKGRAGVEVNGANSYGFTGRSTNEDICKIHNTFLCTSNSLKAPATVCGPGRFHSSFSRAKAMHRFTGEENVRHAKAFGNSARRLRTDVCHSFTKDKVCVRTSFAMPLKERTVGRVFFSLAFFGPRNDRHAMVRVRDIVSQNLTI